VDRFNFFLDEMIRRRNLLTMTRLEKDGVALGRWSYKI